MRHIALLILLAGCGSSGPLCPNNASNPIQPRATDVCDASRTGVQICPRGCNSGYGYTCNGSCWVGFFDGPCAPGGNCGAK